VQLAHPLPEGPERELDLVLRRAPLSQALQRGGEVAARHRQVHAVGAVGRLQIAEPSLGLSQRIADLIRAIDTAIATSGDRYGCRP
jgi:hypothetical protein